MRTETYQKKNFDRITDKDIVVFEDFLGKPIQKAVQASTYGILLCTAGKGYLKLEGKEYEISKNDMVLCQPQVFIDNVMVKLDFKCSGMFMSPSYFESMLFVDGNYWGTGLAVAKKPVIHLEEEEARDFMFNFSILKTKLAQVDMPHHSLTIKHLLQSMLYEFADRLAPHFHPLDTHNGFSSGELIFKKFLMILSQATPKRRDITYFSDQLCITSKYLSTICKKQCGKTASELINGITIRYIKNMLTSSEKTIKEIATETGFDNLSFFGKYVKRELGMSPREFRAKK